MKTQFILSLLMTLFLGGVITGNILGDMKQKTAEIVFFLWKGIQVFRKRVIPANPRTDAQVAHRLFFSQTLKLGQDINTSILQPFWKHLAIRQSEFNAFMSYNLLNMTNGSDYSELSLCRGSLFPTYLDDAIYSTGDEETVISFSSTPTGDQAAGDKAFAALYNEITGVWYLNVAGTALRSDNAVTIVTPANLTVAKLHAYLWFSDKAITDPTFKASNSVYSIVSEL